MNEVFDKTGRGLWMLRPALYNFMQAHTMTPSFPVATWYHNQVDSGRHQETLVVLFQVSILKARNIYQDNAIKWHVLFHGAGSKSVTIEQPELGFPTNVRNAVLNMRTTRHVEGSCWSMPPTVQTRLGLPLSFITDWSQL